MKGSRVLNVQGVKNTIKNKIPKEIEKEVEKTIAESLLRIETRAKSKVQKGPATGKVYKRGDKTHVASAPGQSPATDTGRLVSNIKHLVFKGKIGGEVGVFGAIDGEKQNYGLALELGTSTILARPFLFPAFEEFKPEIRKKINRAIRRAAINARRRK